MLKKEEWTVSEEVTEENALTYIKATLSLSSNQIRTIRIFHLAGVNNAGVTKNTVVHGGDTVSVSIPDERPKTDVPENIPLDVLYEDDDLMIINKPKGMCVIPGPDHWIGTLYNALLYYFGDRPFWIAHRIDRTTTGCLIIAKSKSVDVSLVQQIAKKECFRTYRALCDGVFDEEGLIDAPIGRDPDNFRRMAVTEINAKQARTYYRRMSVLNGACEVQFRLDTGRTHQIRVHAAHAGHPLVDDELYGTTCTLMDCQGAMLHAETLTFIHPVSGHSLCINAPVPEQFDTLKSLLA